MHLSVPIGPAPPPYFILLTLHFDFLELRFTCCRPHWWWWWWQQHIFCKVFRENIPALFDECLIDAQQSGKLQEVIRHACSTMRHDILSCRVDTFNKGGGHQTSQHGQRQRLACVDSTVVHLESACQAVVKHIKICRHEIVLNMILISHTQKKSRALHIFLSRFSLQVSSLENTLLIFSLPFVWTRQDNRKVVQTTKDKNTERHRQRQDHSKLTRQDPQKNSDKTSSSCPKLPVSCCRTPLKNFCFSFLAAQPLYISHTT